MPSEPEHPTAPTLRDLTLRAGLSAPPARVAMALACACALGSAFVAWRWLAPSAPVLEAAVPSAESGLPPAGPSATPSAAVVPVLTVHVVGAVRHPGVYELPAGSRANDAVLAAGGMLGNAASYGVNLARPLADGEQLVVPTRDQLPRPPSVVLPPAPGAQAGAGRAESGGLVDLNSASESDLDALPGIGPATAKRILDDRAKNGPFGKPEDLMRVTGIGAKKFDALKDLVTVR